MFKETWQSKFSLFSFLTQITRVIVTSSSIHDTSTENVLAFINFKTVIDNTH